MEIKEKASLISYIRMINKLWKNGAVFEADRKSISRYLNKITILVNRLDSLT